MEIIYNVGPPFDSIQLLRANNSNNLVYGTQIAIVMGFINQLSYLGGPIL